MYRENDKAASTGAQSAPVKRAQPKRTTGPLGAYPPLDFVAEVKAAAKREGVGITRYVISGMAVWMACGDRKSYAAADPGKNPFRVAPALAMDLAPLARAGHYVTRAINALTDQGGLTVQDLAPLLLAVASTRASVDAMGAALDELAIQIGDPLVHHVLAAYTRARADVNQLEKRVSERVASVQARQSPVVQKAPVLVELRRLESAIAGALSAVRERPDVRAGYDAVLDTLADATEG